MELKDSVFLVTGGSSGIGKAIAQGLVNKGAHVAITGRDKDKLENVANELSCTALHFDVSKPAEIDAMFDEVIEKFGKLDGLINNAGVGYGKAMDEVTWEDFESIYHTNVFGAAIAGARAAKIFKEQNHGNIINIASSAGVRGYAKGSIYSSSKFALRGLTECWRAELRPNNIRVMLINPSEVPTAFGQKDREPREEANNKLTAKEISHAVISVLEMDDRGFIPELGVWATNPF